MPTWGSCDAPSATTWGACDAPAPAWSADTLPTSTWTADTAAPLALTPSISAISPPVGNTGNAVTVTISGANFVAGSTVAVSGAGVTVSNTVVVDSQTITCTLTLAVGATASTRTITVSTGTDTSNMGTFVVQTVPSITSLSASSGQQGAAVALTITGAGFAADATVAISGTGVAVSNTIVVSTTSITCTLTISTGASVDARSVTVMTSVGTSNAATFTVTLLPSTLSGLLGWFDASALVLADGAALVTWPDLSASARDLAAFGASIVYKANVGNGHVGVRINTAAGTSGAATSAGEVLTTAASVSVFVVTREHRTDLGGGYIASLAHANGLHLSARRETSGNHAGQLTELNNNPFWDSPWISAVAYSRLRVEYTGTAASLAGYINSVLVVPTGGGDTNPTNDYNLVTNSPHSIILGNRRQQNAGDGVDIGEYLLYSPALSAADTATVEAYLAAKWQ